MTRRTRIGVLLGLFAVACHHGTQEPPPVVIAPAPSAAVVPQWQPVTPPGLSTMDAARALNLGDTRPDPTSLDDPADDPRPPLPVCTPDQKQACTFGGRKGLQECQRDGQWSECGLVAQCRPGQRLACGGGHSPVLASAGKCLVFEHRWHFNGCDTPLVLAFDGAPVTFTDAPGSFDLRADGSPPLPSRWVSPTTPWLALDLDHSGAIEDARELFGSASLLPSGVRARHGFEALAAHDDDHDGWLTPHDAIWPHLLLWTDTNQDRRSSPDELRPLSSRGITALAVSFREQPRCERGACERERGVVRFVDGQGREREGAVVDVHFGSP